MKPSVPRMTAPAARLALSVILVGGLLAMTACGRQTPEEKFREAAELVQQGQPHRGVLKFKEIVRDHPDDPIALDAQLMLARYYAREGNATSVLRELEAVYSKAPHGTPHHQEAFEGLIQIRLQIRDYEEALKMFEREMEVLPADDQATRAHLEIERAIVKLHLGNDTETTGTAELAREGAETLRTMMIEAGEPEMRGVAREQLANHYRDTGDFQQSNDVYRAYLDAFPEDRIRTEIEMAMAMNDHAAGNTDEAFERFEQLADRYREDIEQELEKARKNQKRNALAQMYTQLEQYDKAEQELRRVMADNVLSPVAINAQFAIAQMYIFAGLGKEDDALFEKGIAVLEQIRRENEATNIAATAQTYIDQSRQALERLKTAAEAEDADAAANAATDAETVTTATAAEAEP